LDVGDVTVGAVEELVDSFKEIFVLLLIQQLIISLDLR
jgi:hypothetical protein